MIAMAALAAVTVTAGFSGYAPQRVAVLTGQTVTWRNDSVRNHTVTADDGSFDSGRIPGDSAFSHRFDAPGAYPYHCTLHAGMTGTVVVSDVLLDAPAAPAGPGRPYPLTGRTTQPAGTQVAIQADSGGGFQPAGTASVGADGAFTAFVTPRTTATYEATAGAATSPPVQMIVLDHAVAARATGRGRRVVVDASVTPAAPGGTAVLQLRLRDRFGWWPVQHARLDAHSRARFTLRIRHRVPARVALTLPDGATRLAVSRVLHVG